MTTETAGTTLRDTLESNFDKLDISGEKPVTEPTQEAAPETPVEVKQEPKQEGRTAGRQRNEKGQLLPGKAEKAETPPAPVTEAAPKPRPQRPSTWKKEYWDHWEKIDPDLAEYLHQREGEFAKGVSTYKGEYDRLKPLAEAIAPYVPTWQQVGIQPNDAIKNLAESDRILRHGTEDEKLQLLTYMAQSYGVPLQKMIVQGQDGQFYLNQQYAQQAPKPQGITPDQVERLVQESMQKSAWLQKVKDFREAKDGSGNPRFPHVAEVEATMAGILRSGLADDLPSAYDAALRLPKHAHLFEAMQKQQAEAKAAEEAKAKSATAAKARAGAVSVKSQAPTGVTSSEKTRKGLRETIAEGLESMSARV